MVQIAPRSRGRPRSFNEEQALDNAIQIFRSKGYDGVTIDDLVAGMGVGRPSLYSIFGDKRTIFLRGLRAYAEKYGALAAKALFSPQTLHASLTGFLRNAVENATEEGSAPGCLLGCVAPLVNDAEVRQFVQDVAAAATAQVERRFRDGISAGEVPSDFPASARASQVMDIARGLTMRAQMGAPRKTLLRDVDNAADLILPPRRETAALES
ncbi:TetR/AcrR family transcriptional regulator [Lichenifustis flavocetrariae]|uniref:TetR/AcrR family transcriptional regulator n=1 Tax=Lichenifustis flavocetrariae TaxID=2949735 RepID=A0AA41Z0S9_9HYPH|nr:TetR/AcrR family transcriptional regulator [Lichenifustis flavocetrariae]MCW6511649.1 TetR/AcrR family transcriptional regulator [Lichenifustis flavocetrariae]